MIIIRNEIIAVYTILVLKYIDDLYVDRKFEQQVVFIRNDIGIITTTVIFINLL